MPSTDEMKQAVEAYTTAHSSKDADAVVALFSPDCVIADPVDRPEMRGRDEVRAFFHSAHEASEDFDLHLTGPVRAVGNWAAAPLRAVTTMGGMSFAIDIIDVFTFDDDGLIADMRAYWTASDIQELPPA